jgi:hypothetical protein
MAGVLPPIRPGHAGTSKDRSPYKVSIASVIETFATSPQRISILEGFLNFRQELYTVGMSHGFQWLDGSFTQNVETHESRSPNDIDVVTFFLLSSNDTQQNVVNRNPSLFDEEQVKKTYSVDSYFMALGAPVGKSSVQTISYWYSMWSHCRDGLWKGFLQVDLNADDDVIAQQMLNQRILEAKHRD